MANGLFVGLVTLDVIYLTAALPQPNQKLVALDYAITAGGPATNAAIAFQHFSNFAQLMGVVGRHPVSQFVWADLQQYQLQVLDLQPDSVEPLPTSSILVTQTTGERAVISINATRSQASPDQIPAQALQGVDVVLIDGHQMAVGQALAQQSQALQIPVVVDGGSWKPGFEAVLRHTDYAVCSANFRPPHCQTQSDVLHYLQALEIPHIAITNGEQPIIGWSDGEYQEIAVPTVRAVDTLGAGDILHGAFCHFLLHNEFVPALHQAAQVAAHACQFFGTRQWMRELAA